MEKAGKVCKGILLLLLAVSWCVMQTTVGTLIALILLPKARYQKYRGMIIVYHPYAFTFSLGTFAFVSDGVEHPRTIRGKMYGYYVQSLLLGPFFLFAVILPKLIVRIPPIKRYRAERDLIPEDIFPCRQAARLQSRYGE